MTKIFFLYVARPTALLAMGGYPSLKLSIALYMVDLDLFTNYITYQCYIELKPPVRNGLSLKYRVHCSRV
jgi:hypothetical protein